MRIPIRPVALVLSLCAAGPMACTDQGDRVARQLADLRTEMAELRRGRSTHRVRLEELQSRVFILEDRMETARLALSRQGRKPDLPVVTVQPIQPNESRGGAAVAEPVPVLRVGPSPSTRTPGDEYSDANRRGIDAGARLAVSPVPAAPKVSGKKLRKKKVKQPTPSSTGEAGAAYRKAYEAMRAGKIDAARESFERFGREFPKHDLSDNAQYWVGECFYARKKFKDALREFRRVIDEYPTGNKVPDSLLKIGLSYQSLGDGRTAKDVLGQVIEIFPDSPAAKVARERLERM